LLIFILSVFLQINLISDLINSKVMPLNISIY